MSAIILGGQTGQTDTLVPNRFLDYYMPEANGEFVKIYLYLLRALSQKDSEISVCHIADIFNHTEKDVMRALRYWQKLNLLDLQFCNNKLTGITLKPLTNTVSAAQTSLADEVAVSANNTFVPNDSAATNKAADPIVADAMDTVSMTAAKKTAGSLHGSETNTPATMNSISPAYKTISTNNTAITGNSAPADSTASVTNVFSPNSPDATGSNLQKYRFEKHAYTANELAAFRAREEVFEFLYLAEKYIGKPLSGADVNTLIYIYDVLKFTPELIEYLLEYCITNGHKSLRYIEKVALSWAEENINTLELAKAHTDLFNKSCYPVLKAFGLNGRNPGTGEKAMIVKWTNTYGFQMEIILEACNRTMNTIHQPSFDYADSILTSWRKKGVRSMADIQTLDNEHSKIKSSKSAASQKSHTTAAGSDNKSKNSFNNFDQRSYDYEALEKKLLGNA